MVDNSYRRRENLHRNRNESENRRRRGPIGVMEVQVIVCVLAVAFVLVVKQAGGSVYKTLRAGVSQAFNSGVTGSQVSQAFAAIKSQLPDLKSVFDISSSGLSSRAVSASSSSAVSAVSSSAASSKTSSAVSGALSGKGGQDVEAQSAADGTLLAPKTANLGPFLLSAKLVWPVQGNITSGFGYRINPITNKLSFHTGIDIAAAEGTPIGAAMPGVVEDTGTNDAYGNYILINHGGGVESFYGHCRVVTAQKGASVKAGDAIAKVGSTGMSTGSHLHFEIRINRIDFNPTWVLTQRL